MGARRKSSSPVDERAPINHSAFDDPRLSAVAKFVEQSIACGKRVSLTEAARVACLCPQHFSTLFRERVGICFSAWQGRVRTQRAKLLLTQKSWMQLAAVARAVGYDDLSTFGRVFRRCEALAPQQFRWLVREFPQLRGTLVSTGLSAFAYRTVMISRQSEGFASLLRFLTAQIEILSANESGAIITGSEKTPTKS
jgi:AraC-like DNA-binding protein